MSVKHLLVIIAVACAEITGAAAAFEEKIVEKKAVEVGKEKLVGANSFNLVSTLGHYDQPIAIAPVQAVQEVVTPVYANHYTYAKYLVPSFGYGHAHGHHLHYGLTYPNIGYYGHEQNHFVQKPLGYGSAIGHILAYNSPYQHQHQAKLYPQHHDHSGGHGQYLTHGHGHYNQPPVYYSHNYHGHGQSVGLGSNYGVPLYNSRHHSRFGLYH